jgi:autotransporter-associated beta strand protein
VNFVKDTRDLRDRDSGRRAADPARTWRWAAVAVSASVGASSLPAAPPSSGYRLTFVEEFSGMSLNAAKWISGYPWGPTHNHLAYARAENLAFTGESLDLVARRESFGGKTFTTGVISSGYSKFTMNGGYVEARIKLPDTVGSWPAFWGLYTGWPPEADIMEYPLTTNGVNGLAADQYHTAWHYSTASGNAAGAGTVNPPGVGDLRGAYHVFGMEWKEDQWVKFYFNGAQVSSFTTNPSAIAQMQYMYLIANYAVGGWPGTPSLAQWPQGHEDRTSLDWIRVFEEQASFTQTRFIQNNTAVNNWTNPVNWNNGVPDQAGLIVYLGSVTPASKTLDWNNHQATAGEIIFDGATRYTLGTGDENLLLAKTATTDFVRLWSEASSVGGHVINANLEGWGNLSIKNDSAATLTLNGSVFSHSPDAATSGQVKFWGAGTIIVNGNVFCGDEVLVSGTGTTELNGMLFAEARPFTAATRLLVNGGATLQLASLNGAGTTQLGRLPLDAAQLVLDSGRLRLTGATNTRRGFTIGAGGATIEAATGSDVTLTDTGVVSELIVSTAGGRLTLTGESNAARLNKIVPGTGGLTKSGNGTWTLGASNTYTGTTLVNGGTLLVNGSTAASSAVTVNANATLGGSGVVGGAVTVNASGRLSPGGGVGVVGTLTLGSLSLKTQSETRIEVASTGSFDRLLVNGSASLNGALTVSLGSFTPSRSSSFTVLSASSRAGSFSNANAWGLITTDLVGAFVIEYSSTAVVLKEFTTVGDVNLDGSVNNQDIASMVGLLTGGAAAGAIGFAADVDGNGVVNNQDIAPFVALLTGGRPLSDFADDPDFSPLLSLVPEPAGLWASTLVALLSRRRRSRL